MKNFMKMNIICLLLGFTIGCTSFGASKEEIMAYNGQGPNVCLFGGVDKESDAHCTKLNFGNEENMIWINNEAFDIAGNCVDHAARVTEIASEYGYGVSYIYTCPSWLKNCHVSTLITDADGDIWVLDNKALIKDTYGVRGVSSLQNFINDVLNNKNFIIDKKLERDINKLGLKAEELKWH